MRTLTKTALLASLAALSFGCKSSAPSLAGPRHSAGSPTAADQVNAPLLPDPKMTPGATLPVTRDDICVPGYTQKVRNVPADVKRQVYAEYGIRSHKPGEYEVDHLISLELGGSNSIKNLWPQSYLTQPWNARVKDALENELHAEVCSGQIDLAAAQRAISTDWIAAYKKTFHTNVPLGASSKRHKRSRHSLTESDTPTPIAPASGAAPAANSNAQVWVNLKSGKYFHSGSPYYGHTKQGQYMTESQAQQQGYVAARGQ